MKIFRIYIPFVILAALIKGIPSIKFGGGFHWSTFGSFFDLITLKLIKNHLWTMVSIFRLV